MRFRREKFIKKPYSKKSEIKAVEESKKRRTHTSES